MSISRTSFRFVKTFLSGYKDPDIQGLIQLVIFLILSATIFYHFVEGWTFLDSLYFSVTTLFTVGLGDFHPVTQLGKLFTIFYIILGVGAFLGFINLYIIHHRNTITEDD